MPPVFFLPFLSPDAYETSYAHLANKCERDVPALDARVYSVSFEQDGFVWAAAVGEKLRGRRAQQPRHRWTGTEIEDPAMVLAIFPESPYCIITDAGAGLASYFQGHFHAIAVNVVLFAKSTSVDGLTQSEC